MMAARWCVLAAAVVAWCAPDALQTKCQQDFTKLTNCMDYATGHEDAPSSTCCGDTSETQRQRPECLCYIVQQVHSGRNEVQSLGLRFDRLLAMPAACKLPNANVSLCINLLHLTPSSPDYALFANASKVTPSTSTTTPAAAATAGGFKVQAGLSYGVAAAVASAVFSSIF
ncbi:non-specific lipid transfer protein GPI-anchored 1 isoform X2 [Oryza brachyantha]|uniref:non-specific lipid transfer protein GPI-anchored 1 isoform X2 n=1 Tax=Oryza brachyantha TaxID=4533 RepID=UPI001ADAEF14|nr:non-specific lipid transfer protein GPI-anchored 1 isoform X2 [Oryza brachyantha]